MMKRTFSWIALAGLLVLLCGATFSFNLTTSVAHQAPPIVKIDPKVFDAYVGQYTFAENPDLVLSFFRQGEEYYVQVTTQGRFQIFPENNSKFFLKVLDADVT